jgi:hypothetical protein
MRALGLVFALAVLSFSLAACGGDDGDDAPAIDAPAGAIDAPAGSIDAPAAELTCASYCSTIAGNCTAANLMYGSSAECMATCTAFTAGTLADTGGNTLGCRLYHAGNAGGSQTAADTHCRHAGPGGDGVCGANCEGFCTVVLDACAGQAQPPYANMGACMTACGGFATTPIYVANATGNNLACRLYHATAAAANPGLHCPHTGVNSATCTGN